jgi:hypothetical protein
MLRRAPSLGDNLRSSGERRSVGIVHESMVQGNSKAKRSLTQRRHSYAQLVMDADTMLGEASGSMFLSARNLRTISGRQAPPSWLDRFPVLEYFLYGAINPFSNGWLVWTAIMGVVLLIAAFIVPFSVAFNSECRLLATFTDNMHVYLTH